MELRRFAVCHDCLARLRSPTSARPAVAIVQQWASRGITTQIPYQPRPNPSAAGRPHNARSWQIRSLASQTAQVASRQPPPPYQAAEPSKIHNRVQELSASVLRPTESKIPEEERVLYVLEQLEYLATLILDEKTVADGPSLSKTREQKESATSALLGSVNGPTQSAFISKTSILGTISAKAEDIARHPDVFITPAILKSYVQLQGLLRQPASFPDVFDLYARKPVPCLKGNEIAYAPSKPDQIKSAVSSDTANAALATAIKGRDLPLAMDIVSTSFCTLAFKKSKVFRQAAFPIVGLAVAPIAAYSLSSTFSHFQQSMDAGSATGIAFAGIMTYIGAVSMVGYVAVTTANDQMDRVTWASGVPLWERWVREEERAAIDRLAGAWGFKELDKRGEEEGEEWEALREWVGMRGMVLDRVSLMEGME